MRPESAVVVGLARRTTTYSVFLVVLRCLVLGAALLPAPAALAQAFDLGPAGTPQISGSLGGSVTGNTLLSQSLSYVVDFGDVSPANLNSFVKIVLPVAMRSTGPYQVTAVITTNPLNSTAPMSLQLSDIGFGVQNLRSLGGNKATNCGASSIINPVYNNDPTLTANTSGRVSYATSLENLGSTPLLVNGPQLSQGPNFNGNKVTNGWAVDVVLTIAPQFFAAGTFNNLTVTFTIGSSSAQPQNCPN